MQIGGWTALWSCPRRCLGCPESWKKELINDRLKIKYKVYTIRVFHEHYALNSLTEYFFCWRYHKSAAHFQYFPSTHPHIMLFYSLQFCNVFSSFCTQCGSHYFHNRQTKLPTSDQCQANIGNVGEMLNRKLQRCHTLLTKQKLLLFYYNIFGWMVKRIIKKALNIILAWYCRRVRVDVLFASKSHKFVKF